MTTLEALGSDPDDAVREAAAAILAGARRRSTATGIPAITD
jgi:hypothetical protein